jgi:hypothetical protein
MRLRRLLVLLCTALALAACARQTPRYAAAPQVAVVGSELDVRMYGAPQPASYAVRRVTQVVPVAATFGDGPYKPWYKLIGPQRFDFVGSGQLKLEFAALAGKRTFADKSGRPVEGQIDEMMQALLDLELRSKSELEKSLGATKNGKGLRTQRLPVVASRVK